MSEAKISFIIPYRNNEDSIMRCLLSLPPGEILMWDDHSSDKTTEIIRREFNINPFTSASRISLGEMREHLFRVSTGDIIIFQDADDYRLKERTKIVCKSVKDFTILLTPVVRRYKDDQEMAHAVPLRYNSFVDFFQMRFQTCGMIWTRPLLQSINFTREHCWEYAMFYEVLKFHGDRIRYSAMCSSIYTGPGLYSKINSIGQLTTRVNLFKQAIEELKLCPREYNVAVQRIKLAEQALEKLEDTVTNEACLVACFTSDDDYANGKRCLSNCPHA